MPALTDAALRSRIGASAAHAGDTTISVGPSLKNSIVSAASGVSGGGGAPAPAAGLAAASDQAASRAAASRPRARLGARAPAPRLRRMVRRAGSTWGSCARSGQRPRASLARLAGREAAGEPRLRGSTTTTVIFWGRCSGGERLAGQGGRGNRVCALPGRQRRRLSGSLGRKMPDTRQAGRKKGRGTAVRSRGVFALNKRRAGPRPPGSYASRMSRSTRASRFRPAAVRVPGVRAPRTSR
jgi:hypothetical protein